MAPPAGNKRRWDDSDSEDERKRGKKSSSTKKGKSGRPRLCAPTFNQKRIHGASQTMNQSVVEAFMLGPFKQLPATFRLRLIQIIEASKADNKVYKDHADEFSQLLDRLESKVGDGQAIPKDCYPASLCVLAAYLGATVPDEKDWISDGTFSSTDPALAALDPRSRQTNDFRAYVSGPQVLSDQGTVTCYCGRPASYAQQRSWGNKKVVNFFQCKEGQCRFHITADALSLLKEMMNKMGVARIPLWFCPKHPELAMKISEVIDKDTGEGTLTVQCPFYENNDGQKTFCHSEPLGPEGDDWLMTGEVMWKSLALFHDL